jgi:predicted alpha/beta-hydrolase family hydrolase
VDRPGKPAFLVVMTHGAGGGVDTKDLLAVRDVAVARGAAVARVLQPYRVRGARAPGAPGPQDAAWLEIISALREEIPDVPLVQGGRSNGARVACRTAAQAGARAVIALAFPLHPPGRPEQSRADELRAAGTQVLVVNGERDPFGIPDTRDASTVVVLAGETHSLSKRPAAVGEAVGSWLDELAGLTSRR